MGILGTGIEEGLLLKPVKYQWAMDLYDQAVANTWFPNEIQLGEDIADFKKMTDEERHAVTFLISYFNPNELLVNKALAFGVYPYVNAPEAHLYLAKQMWEEANHCMSFEYVLETFPIDRNEAYNSHVDIPSMARKEEFQVEYIRRMTEETLDIKTTEGKQDFVRNLVAYNIVGTVSDLEQDTQSEVIKFSASGFRDFTRIAASDPVMWRDVFLTNRDAVLEMLGRFLEDLSKLQRMVRVGDGPGLEELFTRTRAIRRSIITAGQETAAADFGRPHGEATTISGPSGTAVLNGAPAPLVDVNVDVAQPVREHGGGDDA